MTRLNRHALYYRLIDISFGCQLVMIAAAGFKAATGNSATTGLLAYPFAALAIVGLFLPPLLIFQRWMRDDFSEMLWQKTAGTVLKALVILPLPVMVAVAVAFATGSTSFVPPESDMAIPREAVAALAGILRTMVFLWLVSPVLFTFAFQWHRWRASR